MKKYQVMMKKSYWLSDRQNLSEQQFVSFNAFQVNMHYCLFVKHQWKAFTN